MNKTEMKKLVKKYAKGIDAKELIDLKHLLYERIDSVQGAMVELPDNRSPRYQKLYQREIKLEFLIEHLDEITDQVENLDDHLTELLNNI